MPPPQPEVVHLAKLLIVDDDPSFAHLIQLRLQRAGHTASLKTGPLGVIDELKRDGYDAVLLDVMMPALDGPALVRMIRRLHERPELKIILCSGMERDDLADLASRLEVDGYLSKSEELRNIAESVGAVLASPRKASH